MEQNNMKSQSNIINMMRFPLIILVVSIHMIPSTELIVFSKNDFSYYVFFSELISHNIGRIAVPCFFLFSGYYYFFNCKNWTLNFYLNQQRKRFTSLILPYFIHNYEEFHYDKMWNKFK